MEYKLSNQIIMKREDVSVERLQFTNLCKRRFSRVVIIPICTLKLYELKSID